MAKTEPSMVTRAHSLSGQLLDEIVQRGLSEGAFFGTEDDLCRKFDVSRSIAREAVGRLVGMGILKSRRNKGLIVCQSDPVALFSQTLPFSGQSPDQFRQLVELRCALEMGAIEMAVLRATDAQVRHLAEAAEEYAAADAVLDMTRMFQADLRFHWLILDMTDNAMIAGMHHVLSDYFLAEQRPRKHAHMTRTIWEHRALAQAIGARTLDTARALIRDHLAPVWRDRNFDGAQPRREAAGATPDAR